MPDLKELRDTQLAHEVADLTVKKVFAIMGVDINSPQSVENFRANLRFSERLRKISDHGTLVFVGAVVLMLTTAVGLGIAELFKRGSE